MREAKEKQMKII